MNDHDYTEILDAIEAWHTAVKTLKRMGVFRSQQWLADYGEWLVVQIYGGELAKSRTQPGWDVLSSGRRLQVRTSFTPLSGGYTRCDLAKEFDELVAIGLTDTMRLDRMYRVDKDHLTPLVSQGKEKRVNWTAMEGFRVNVATLPAGRHLQALLAAQSLTWNKLK